MGGRDFPHAFTKGAPYWLPIDRCKVAVEDAMVPSDPVPTLTVADGACCELCEVLYICALCLDLEAWHLREHIPTISNLPLPQPLPPSIQIGKSTV